MNTHSLFGYLFIALFSLLVVSCYSTPDGVMSSLSQAEKIMESRPDSAMAILQHIPTPETLHGKAQADYSLLMTQAMDKNYINFTSDSLIKFAVGYYGGHTEDLVAKGKSFYYYGRVMESLDKVEDAMTFYLKAKDVLQSSDQFKLLGLISEGIGTLNRKQKLFDTALNSYKESLTYYSLVPDSLCMTYANRNIGRVFLYKNRLDSAYYYYDKAIYISNANKYVAVGSLLLELGVIHRSEKDYIGAERYFLTFLEKEKTPNKLYSGYLALGNLYLYMNRFEDAEHFLMLCLDSPDPVVKRDACECLYDLEKESNKFKEAVIYKDIADSLRMMTQDIDTQNAIADLQGRYNNEKWQRESLQSSIEKKNILLISSFVGFIAVMVIIYRWVLSIPFFISCIRQQNPLTVLSKIILRKVKQFNLPPQKKMRDFCIFEDTPRLFLLGNRQFTFIAHNLDVAEDVVGQICHRHIRLCPYNPYCPDNKAVHTLLFKTEYVLDKATGLGLAPVLSLLFFCQRMIPTAFLADYRIHAMLLHG